jgi:hypothetical protein
VGAIVFSRGGPERRVLGGAGPVRIHHRENMAIEEWEVKRQGGRHQETHAWLVYKLHSWTVHIPVGPRQDSQDIVDRVWPQETADGFVIIEVALPARLAEGYGEAGGPQLAFGDLHPLPDFVSTNPEGLLINVAPSECGAFQPTVQINGDYASACLEDALFVNGTSFSDSKESRDRLAAIVKGLRLVELKAAS